MDDGISKDARIRTLVTAALEGRLSEAGAERLAAYSKRRRQDEQPIRRDLADALAPWLESRSPGQPVFNMPDKPVVLIKADLAAARQAWLNEARRPEDRKEREGSDFLAYRDSAGRVADFHSLRHTYVSRLVQSGANVKVAQELARHSTPMLTLAGHRPCGPDEGAGRPACHRGERSDTRRS
jgi:integrase